MNQPTFRLPGRAICQHYQRMVAIGIPKRPELRYFARRASGAINTWPALCERQLLSSILLKNSVLKRGRLDRTKAQLADAQQKWRFREGFQRLDLDQEVALAAFLVIGVSHFAIRRKFCAVAASRNSSCAPLGPRSRNRSSFKMRFKWANNISTFLRCRRECRYAGVSPMDLATSLDSSCTLRAIFRIGVFGQHCCFIEH